MNTVQLSLDEKKLLLQYVNELNGYFAKWLYNPVLTKLEGVVAPDLVEISAQIGNLSYLLQQNLDKPVEFLPEHKSCAKLAVQLARRKVAEKQENLLEKTHHVSTQDEIEDLMSPINRFMESDWFLETEALRLPSLTEYLTLEVVYSALSKDAKSPGEEFESKFGVLRSQRSFFAALDHARVEATLRNTLTTVAFVDIDNFKGFNDELTETVVDRLVLPPILRAIESHVYSHGSAYQFGGDEFVLLLPNSDADSAETFLLALQNKLAKLPLKGDLRNITVSIGYITVPSDSLLTNREILDLAALAKRSAKIRKDAIATWAGTDFSEDRISLRERRAMVLQDNLLH